MVFRSSVWLTGQNTALAISLATSPPARHFLTNSIVIYSSRSITVAIPRRMATLSGCWAALGQLHRLLHITPYKPGLTSIISDRRRLLSAPVCFPLLTCFHGRQAWPMRSATINIIQFIRCRRRRQLLSTVATHQPCFQTCSGWSRLDSSTSSSVVILIHYNPRMDVNVFFVKRRFTIQCLWRLSSFVTFLWNTPKITNSWPRYSEIKFLNIRICNDAHVCFL